MKLKTSISTVSTNQQNIFRKAIKNAKEEHDAFYIEPEWDLEFFDELPKTNEKPYFSNKATKEAEKLRKKEYDYYNNFMGNLVPPNRNWVGHDTPVRMDLLHRVRNQQLCRGTVSLK